MSRGGQRIVLVAAGPIVWLFKAAAAVPVPVRYEGPSEMPGSIIEGAKSLTSRKSLGQKPPPQRHRRCRGTVPGLSMEVRGVRASQTWLARTGWCSPGSSTPDSSPSPTARVSGVEIGFRPHDEGKLR